MLLAVVNICLVIFLVIKYNPKKVNSLLSTLSTNLSQYPDDLIVSIHKGRLVTNNNRPYLLWLDQNDKKNLLLVIDETATQNKIRQYNSSALLTAQELVVNESSIPLGYLDDQKLTKQEVNQFVQTIDKARSLLPVLFVVGALLLLILTPLASFVITFIYLLIASVIVFLVFKVFFQKHFHFRKIFQVSFHAITFPLALDYVFMFVRPTIPMSESNLLVFFRQIPFPMLFLVILAVFVAVGVYEAHGDGKVRKSGRMHAS